VILTRFLYRKSCAIIIRLIYEINCKDCNQKYIGQTKRPIITRFKEHMAHRKFGRFEKSSAAQHIFESDH
jgi:hypothetical protein